MSQKKLDAVTLILDGSRGIYIPRDFLCGDNNEIAAEHCALWGLTEDNKEHWVDAVEPDSEGYWDAWAWILDNARYTDAYGDVYVLHHDDDLFALCIERMTAEEKANFGLED
jgi:hypothetical protein